ncbi:hypothetical protein ONS96_005355 [Cadophora gregata f. sp. sojae]|nr:hypothetical protein ONS96_005355 [Cadophora gregata f. sp. sojae]
MFTIRGAANGPIASANQKSSDPLMQKRPSIEGAPTGPRYPKLARKKRPSKADPAQPESNRLLEPLPPFKKSSTEHYPQLTNLPIDATETAKRISALPIVSASVLHDEAQIGSHRSGRKTRLPATSTREG